MAIKLLLLLLFSLSTFTLISAGPLRPESPSKEEMEKIVDALVGAAEFQNWAELLSDSDPSLFPITATLFVPSDNSISNPSYFNPSTIPYHIVPLQLSFSFLLQLPIGSTIPTLLPGKTIIVTNNSIVNYTIDGSQITRPDLYLNGEIVVHGVSSVLNYSTYGGGFFLDPKISITIPTSSSSSPGPTTG